MHIDNAMGQLGAIKNAGAIFLGEWTPEAVGDYVAGPNHTLPTGGTAKFSSPLGTMDFMKHSSVIQYTQKALADDGESIVSIADREGLWSHAESVRLRLAEL
jgi:histidinol dehydrogenase